MKRAITLLSVAVSTLLASPVLPAPPASGAATMHALDPQSGAVISPASYANLAFTAVTPCRIMDTRPAQGGSGPWIAGTSNLVKIGPYATGYASGPGAQGGSPTSCGLDTMAGPGQLAAILAAVSTLGQAAQGYLTFYPQQNAAATSVSQRYQPGYTQTAFVLISTDLVGAVSAWGTTSATTDVIIDIVGYFSAGVADGVTSVSTGAGLTGGPITGTGTIGLAATNLLPTVACTANQIPKWSGSAWACAADSTGGTVTGVSATAPLVSSGGSAPNISLGGANYGEVLGVGFGGELPGWTASPYLAGNLTFFANPSTPGAGSIMKMGNPFLHNVGEANTFVGLNAGNFALTGVQNTGAGQYSMYNLSSGSSNTGIGYLTLSQNTSGSFNTALGRNAMSNNHDGFGNTAVGADALNNGMSGFNNVAIGLSTLQLTSGSSNTAVGFRALQVSSGNSNIGLGNFAGANIGAGNFNIFVGNGGLNGDNATIRIGETQTKTFVAGIRGVATGVANGVAVLIDSNGQLGTASSSRHVKDDIADMDAASSALMKLRPVTFHYKSDPGPAGRSLQYGLIAEEVETIYPELVAHSSDGKVETVMYQFLPPMLLNEVQRQQRRIETLEREKHGQGARIEVLEKRVTELLDRMTK
jgi:hypothetical protein